MHRGMTGVHIECDSPPTAYFAAQSSAQGAPRLNLDEERIANGLAQLVLTVIRLIHELMERQAIRRMEGGSLSEEQVERLGRTLMAQAEEIRRTAERFGLREEDLNLDLGPLGRAL